MYKRQQLTKTSLNVNKAFKGEPIETKVNRIVNSKEPIKDGAPIMYTERKDGVRPEMNIRTDRMEIAVDKMDFVARANENKRMEAIKSREAAKNTQTERNSGEPPTPPITGNQQS